MTGFRLAGRRFATLRRGAVRRIFVLAVGMTLGVATMAPAVVGDLSVSVTDAAGHAVVGAKISFGNVVAQTDESGKAQLSVPEGTGVLVVEHKDYGTHRETVSVPGGGTTQVSVQLVEVAPAGGGEPMTAVNSGPAISLQGGEDDAQPPKGGEGSSTETIVDNGETVFQETTPENAAEENAQLVANSKVKAATAELSLVLRRGGGNHAQLNTSVGSFSPVARYFGANPGGYGDASASSPSRGRRFLPVLSIAVGEADYELQINGRNDPSIRNRFADHGLIWGAGLDVVWMLCRDCGWHIGVGARYRELNGLEANREPMRTFAHAQTLEDKASLDYTSKESHLFIGHGWPRVAIYAGARFIRREVDINGRQVFDYSEYVGHPLQDIFTFDSKIQSDETEGLLGVAIRLGHSRFALRAEGTSDGGNNHSVTAGLTADLGKR